MNQGNFFHSYIQFISLKIFSFIIIPIRKVIATTCLMAGTSGSKEKVTYVLKNRPPHFDINMRKFVLNYNGRAKQSSKNNFQIFDESFPDEILMQLGKVETGEYNCDYTWPLCAMQAFGLAISSLSR